MWNYAYTYVHIHTHSHIYTRIHMHIFEKQGEKWNKLGVKRMEKWTLSERNGIERILREVNLC